MPAVEPVGGTTRRPVSETQQRIGARERYANPAHHPSPSLPRPVVIAPTASAIACRLAGAYPRRRTRPRHSALLVRTPLRRSLRHSARLLRLPLKGGVILEACKRSASITPPLRGNRREGEARLRAGGGPTRRPKGMPTRERGRPARTMSGTDLAFSATRIDPEPRPGSPLPCAHPTSVFPRGSSWRPAIRQLALLLIVAVGSFTAAASPAGEDDGASCDDWNTRNFFTTASVDRVTACLEAGADPNAKIKSGETPLHFAAMYSADPAIIAKLVEAGADLEAREQYGDTPLHEAARINDHPAIIAALLEAGAESNPHPAVIETLLDGGADATLKDQRGKTPGDPAEGNPGLQGTVAYRRLKEAR